MTSHTTASFYLGGMLAAGILLASTFHPGLLPSASLAAGALCLLGLRIQGIITKGYWLLAGLTTLGVGVLSMAAAIPANQTGHYTNHLVPEFGSLEIEILRSLKSGKFTTKYTGEVLSVDGKKTHGQILLEIAKDSLQTPLSPGDRLCTPVAPVELVRPLNPGSFDYAAFLNSQGIHRRLKLSSDSYFFRNTRLVSDKPLLAFLRMRLLKVVDAIGMAPNETQIAKALLLGERSGTDPELQSRYKKAGVLHLLAISGLHIGILAAFIFTLLSPLKRIPFGKEIRLMLGLTLLWVYALIAGFSPSVVRAVILYSFAALSLYLNRRGQSLHFLGLCWIFMLLTLNPNWLFQAGFQLSFAAVAAIVVFYPPLFRIWPLPKGPGKYPGQLIAVSLAAQVGTLPLTLYYFHQFPGLFLLSNLVLLPGIGLVLITGLICLTLQHFNMLPELLKLILNQFLSGMNAYTQWASGQEKWFLEGISLHPLEFILIALALFLTGLYLRTRSTKALHTAAAFLVVFQLVGIYQEIRLSNKRLWVIPNQVSHTMIWHQGGGHLTVFRTDSLSSDYAIRDAKRFWNADTVLFKPLRPIYNIYGLKLRVLDKEGLYSPWEPSPYYILLSGSPRIHLGRMLNALQPKVVIADASNYPSDLRRWARSCQKAGIAFYATAEQGAYEFKATP